METLNEWGEKKKKKEQKYLLETFSKAQSNAHYNDIDEIDATKSH